MKKKGFSIHQEHFMTNKANKNALSELHLHGNLNKFEFMFMDKFLQMLISKLGNSLSQLISFFKLPETSRYDETIVVPWSDIVIFVVVM